jgi:hypothetical protein
MAKITINIKDARLADAKEKIFRARPVPMDEEADPPVPEYTDLEWITKIVENGLKALYNTGKKKLAADADSDNDIFE